MPERRQALITNLRFTLPMENEVMGAILNDGKDARVAAEEWLKANPKAWEAGSRTSPPSTASPVSTRSRRASGSASPARHAGDLSLRRPREAAIAPGAAMEDWITEHKIPLGAWLKAVVDFLNRHAQGFFDFIILVLGSIIDGLLAVLEWFPPLVLVALLVVGAYFLHRSIVLAAGVLLGLLLVMNLGYWEATLETLALVLCATLVSVAIGVPIGIAAAHRPWLYTAHPAAPRPDADDPDLRLPDPDAGAVRPRHGAGPDLDRDLRHRRADPPHPSRRLLGAEAALEAGEAFGATRRQLLWKVELPYALPTIMAGITQCIMLSLSMVVIAALVGADGLGKPVVRALNTVNVSMGFEAGPRHRHPRHPPRPRLQAAGATRKALR